MSDILSNGGFVGHSQLFRERIQFVGGVSAGGSTTASIGAISLTALTGGIGTAPIEGDLVLVSFTVSSTVDRTLSCSGNASGAYIAAHTEIYQIAATTFDTNLATFYDIMGDTPDTSLTLSVVTGAASDAWAAVVYVFRYVDAANPLDVATTTASASGSALADPPAITPSTLGCVIILIGAAAHASGLQYFYSITDSLQGLLTNTGNTTNDVTIGSLIYWNWTSGAYDPIAFRFSATNPTNGSWAAATIALRPEHPTSGSTGIWSVNSLFNSNTRNI